jgi:hypothetical protein
MAGSYSSDVFKYIMIEIKLCLDNQGCITTKEFTTLVEENKLKLSYEIRLSLLNSVIDPK